MFSLIQAIEARYKKPAIVDVRSGDTVRVHQRIQEGGKTRVQVFEGLVIRTRNMGSLSASILTRRIASGVGVEKGFLLHSPLIEKVEVVKRSKVRRNYLSYMRERQGKSARLSGVEFDREAVNKANDVKKEVDEAEVPGDDTQAAQEAAVALAEPAADVKKKSPDTSQDEDKKREAHPTSSQQAEKKKQEVEIQTQASEPPDQELDSAKAQSKDDKSKSKKEKAEAFRQAQAAKK